MLRSLRKRLETSDTLARGLGVIIAGWLRFCNATTRWDLRVDDALAAALAKGPVVVILWHEHVMMGPIHWKRDFGPAAILRDTSPAARVAGAVQVQFGMTPFAMHATTAPLGILREVVKCVQAGSSLGITGDGPKGPARVLKDAPIEWMRATGRPVFLYSWATARQRRVNSWDRMILPLPFTRGVGTFRAWGGQVPRRTDATTMEAIRQDISNQLDALSTEMERAATAG